MVNQGEFAGLFRGSVYDAQGNKIPIAEDYFINLAKQHGKEMFAYWELIGKRIDKLCDKHLKPFMEGADSKFGYQSGFGGDEGDGLIDYYLPSKPTIPSFKFTIRGVRYTMKWRHLSGEE